MYLDKPIIDNVIFENPIMNASGCWSTTENELNELVTSQCSGIVTRSCTYDCLYGSCSPNYYKNDKLSLCEDGTKNEGYKYYNKLGKNIIDKKPYIISITEKKKGEMLQITHELLNSNRWNAKCNANFIELNLSNEDENNKIIGYDWKETNKYLRYIFQLKDCKNKIGIKLPPYTDFHKLGEFIDIVKDYPISFITSTGSLRNGIVLDEKYNSVILPNSGYSAIGGPLLKPIGLGNVKKLWELTSGIPIIGCGGIETGKDICDYLYCGASMVQVGTKLVEEGPKVFDRLLKEYNEEKKNINNY